MFEVHDGTMYRADVLHPWSALRFTAVHRWPFIDFIAVHRLHGRLSLLWAFTDFTEQVKHCLRRYVEGCVEAYTKILVELLG